MSLTIYIFYILRRDSTDDIAAALYPANPSLNPVVGFFRFITWAKKGPEMDFDLVQYHAAVCLT